jgi:hypothetical protein
MGHRLGHRGHSKSPQSLLFAGVPRTGWGTWIRTKIDGVRVRCSTVELSPNGPAQKGRLCAWAWRVNSEATRAAQAFRIHGRAVQFPACGLASVLKPRGAVWLRFAPPPPPRARP